MDHHHFKGNDIPHIKLDPDIVTLGKIVGGGFPKGVICGKDEFMNYANTS